ncbi:MAG: ROK family protein, partial [Turicibacter sp.]
MMGQVIGIDIGGTNIRVALINSELEIVNREVAKTEDFNRVEDLFGRISKMVLNVSGDSQVEAIGLVLPAPWHKEMDKIVDITNVPCLEEVKVEQIKQYFPKYRVYLENDVNVIALLESDCGAAKHARHSLYVTVSTGIGSGVIMNHHIYHGANGYAGEIGGLIISDEITKDGLVTLEERCSGKALALYSQRLYGADATPELLFKKYQEGCEEAVHVLSIWLDELAKGLVNVVQVNDPEVIVLGGPVILNNDWLIEKLEMKMKQKLFGQLSQKLNMTVAK